MNLSAQHKRALVAHIRDLTNASEDDVASFLVHLFGDTIAYEDLRAVNVSTVSEALRDAGIKVPAIRREPIAKLIGMVRATTYVCDRCGRTPLVVTGAEVASVTRCPTNDGGVFVRPEATTFTAWSDGASYPIGTTHDANGCPITDEAVAGEREVSPKTAEVLRESGVSLPVYLAALLRFGKVRTPAAALSALSQWGTAFVSVAEMRAFVVGLKGATVKTVYGGCVPEELIEVRGVVADLSLVAPTTPPATPEEQRRARKALREKFARCYATSAKTRQIASDAGIITSRIAWDQAAEYLWLDVLSEASKTGALDRLVALARAEYPDAGF